MKLLRKPELPDLVLSSVAASGKAANDQTEDQKAGSRREKTKKVDNLHDQHPTLTQSKKLTV